MVNRSALLLTVTTGLLLALSAFLLVNERFQPLSLRWTVEGRDRAQYFSIGSREPLFLEYDLVVRSEERQRPTVAVTLNDRPVTVPAVSAAYSTAGANVPLPFDAVRSGTNVLRVRIGGAASNTFEMRARLHNYFGIAPDFPRAVVVGDEAVAYRRAQTSLPATAGRILVLIGLSIGSVWLLAAVAGRRTGRWAHVHLLATVVGPLAAVAFGIGRPLHLWLSPEAMIVVALVPWLVVQGALWVLAHRAVTVAVVAPVVVTLVVLEGALRLVNAVRPMYVFYSDSYGRFRGQPGERFFDATFNSRGFNDVEHPVMRPVTVAYRVVALGDSFAVGVVPQRDNFLTRLESLLSTQQPLDGARGKRVEVVNLGVSATEPRDYLSLLADEGLAYGPDIVLVNFFIGNDFETRRPRWHERSYLATLARAFWLLGRAPSITTLTSGSHTTFDDNAPSLGMDAFMEVQVDRTWIYERDSPRVTDAVARAAGFVRQMRDLTRRGGSDLLVTLIPDETQIDTSLRARVVAARGGLDDQFDWQQPNRLLTQALAEERIEVLDLLPALSEAARQARVYKPTDTHWNIAGNRVAAEAIARTLESRVSQASAK